MKPELVHLQTLKQSLTNGGPIRGNIMHISSRPQLNELQGLIAAHGLGGSMTVILTDDAKDSPGAFHTRVPARRKNQPSKQLDVALLDVIEGSRGP